MLTFDGHQGDKPIAIVRGGKYNNKKVYLAPEKNNTAVFKSDIKNTGKYLSLKDGVFEVIPNEKTRVSFAGGPSGAGKSTIAGTYIKNYLRMHPKAPFILFSQKLKDPVLDKYKPQRISIDEDLLENPIEIDDIPNKSIVVYDDCDTVLDKDIQDLLNTLKAQIMEIGRSRGIQIYIIQHLINSNERKIGRTIMNEIQQFTCFPGSGSSRPIKYFLKEYCELGPMEIEKILNINSRHITILKDNPQIIIGERFISLLRDL